jgi:peroxiredoxin
MRVLLLGMAIAALLPLTGCAYFSALGIGLGAGMAPLTVAMERHAQRGMAQDFAMTLLDGNQVNLSDYRGRPVVLNFWADWCPPCRAELPDFQQVYSERPGQFVLLAVAVSSSGDPAPVAKEEGFTFDVAWDKGGAGADLYGVRGIPMSLFIDRDGRIVDKVIGGMDKATFEASLAKIL